MFELLIKIGLVALLWSGVALAGVAAYFIYRAIKDEWL